MQQPGELLYVPEGFYHATSCVGDAVAITQHSFTNVPGSAYDLYANASHQLGEWKKLARKQFEKRPEARQKLALARDLLEQALSMDETNAEIMLKMVFVHEVQGDSVGAIAALRRVVSQVRRQPPFCLLFRSGFIDRVCRCTNGTPINKPPMQSLTFSDRLLVIVADGEPVVREGAHHAGEDVRETREESRGGGCTGGC